MRWQFHWSACAWEGGLELGDFGEVEIVDFHGGDDHLEGFFAGGADGGAEQFDVVEHFDDGLVEAEVADGAGDASILDEEKAVAGHAGHDLFVGIDFADVPEAGDEQAAFGGGDHFFDGGIAAGEDEIHGGFAVLVGESETMAGGLFAGGFGGRAGIDEIARDAAIYEQNFLARQAFAVKGGALLQRVIGVVGDGDVLSEELLAHALVEAGALVFEGGGGEIVKEEADEIEDGGGLQDYVVAAGGEFARVDGEVGFFAGAGGEFLRVVIANIGGVGLGPTGGGAVLNSDGKLRMGFAIGGEEAARISESGLALATRIDSGGDLAILDGQIASAADGPGAFFGGKSGS